MRGYPKTPDQIHEIEDAFADGMSLRAVVREFHISRQTARIIRDGRHPLQNVDPIYERCPGCGGKVTLPCVLCRVQKVMCIERAIRVNLHDRRQQVDTKRWR
ncbi:hypothetical protein HOV93_40080 [Planctomycetes bacterium FF15]|uniref:Resolvase HTH domain-containing protein n=2 Tax=Bremerella alba TaxID=980252 RepID=A0A7V8V8W8_9BACT|nr:hypothetical protein [Bremerella alba]